MSKLHPLTKLIYEEGLLVESDSIDELDTIIRDYFQERAEIITHDLILELEENKNVERWLQLSKDEEEKTFVDKLFELQERLNNKFPSAQAFWKEFINTADKIANEHFCQDKKKQSAPKEEKIGTITKEIFEEHFREDKPQQPEIGLPEKMERSILGTELPTFCIVDKINEIIAYLESLK